MQAARVASNIHPAVMVAKPLPSREHSINILHQCADWGIKSSTCHIWSCRLTHMEKNLYKHKLQTNSIWLIHRYIHGKNIINLKWDRSVHKTRRLISRYALNGVRFLAVPVPPSDRSPGHCCCYEPQCCSDTDETVGPAYVTVSKTESPRVLSTQLSHLRDIHASWEYDQTDYEQNHWEGEGERGEGGGGRGEGGY